MSKQITWLEEELAVTLFIRNTRSLTLTSAGQALYQFTKRFFLDFESLKQSLHESEHQVSGNISLTSPHMLGVDLVCPHLADFSLEHPRVSFKVNLENKLLDLSQHEIDLAIRTIVVKDNNYLYKKINRPDFRRSAFASPEYLKKYGKPKTPKDLEQHNCIMHTEEKSIHRWRFKDDMRITVSGNYQSNSVYSTIEMAKKHVGIIYVYYYQVEAAIKRGELVEVLSEYALDPEPIYLCYVNQTPIPKKLSTLIDFLLQRLSSANAAH